MSTSPPGGGTPPGGPCIPCTTGNLHVRVFLQTVCWDTDPMLGENTPDRPFHTPFVYISGPTSKPRQTSINGEAFFAGLAPGTYSVRVEKSGFNDVSQEIHDNNPIVAPFTSDILINSYEVTAHNTTEAVRVMRRDLDPSTAPVGTKHLECKRKHAMKTPGVPGTRSIWLPIFWFGESEPWIMWLRDLLWVGCMITMIVALATSNFLMGAFFASFASYLLTVIFGQIPGVIAITLAGVGWIVIMVVSAIEYAFGGHPSPIWICFLNATWAGFLYALAVGRTKQFFNSEKLHIIIGGIIGAVLGIVLLFVFGGVGWPDDTAGKVGIVFLIILLALLAFVFAAVAAMLSHVFMNDNKLEGTLHWLDGFLLPYAGEHYCVQGHRGFISHSVLNADQEFSYDWEFPLGTPILNSKEGHIIQDIIETQDGFQGVNLLGWQIAGNGNQNANEIKIRHFDGTVANYLHLKKGGVTAIVPDARTAVHGDGTYPGEPLHAHLGTRIAEAGNVGISMFSHLHYMVDRGGENPPDPGEVSFRRPVKFLDADTARHGNRCYSMRKYLSANLDAGPVKVLDHYPPFKPGGTPTDGSQFPAGPMPPPSPGAPGLGDMPPPPSPPSPPPGGPPGGPTPPPGAPTPPVV
ncbi:MAG: hypothetical protein U0R19_06490 [Bryobacteraceae bacterium]